MTTDSSSSDAKTLLTTAVEVRLKTERNAWLTTVRPDGRPHLVPIWFVYARSRFWVGTGRHSVKARNIKANALVSIALEDGDEPVVAEGRVAVHQELRPSDVVEAFAAKYGWDMTVAEDPDVGTVDLWEIEPTHWLFGKPDASQSR